LSNVTIDPPRSLRVAVVGNPNAGKTTLYNALTGASQKVGNYPGVTVEKVTGKLKLAERTVDCIDIPGLYTLNAVSEDERVAAEVVSSKSVEPADLFVYVLDATNLERNLFLFSQIAEFGRPMMVALTMTDRLAGKPQSVDPARLAAELGVDVIPVVAFKDRGIAELKGAIDRNLISPRVPSLSLDIPTEVLEEVEVLRDRLARAGIDATVGETRAELLAPSEAPGLFISEFPEMKEAIEESRSRLAAVNLLRPSIDTQARYAWAKAVQGAALTPLRDEPSLPRAKKAPSRTDRIDAVLTHRVFGLAIFTFVMYLVFQSIYTFATPVMDLIDGAFTAVKDGVSSRLPDNDFRSLLVDGVLNGIGSALVFLPQILILFFFISILEGTGYLARAAFLMDRLLGWCGLNGRAFIPLLSSFACAIPGVMAARVMPDSRSRLVTILVAPLMSCSARLPVYLLLISTFVEPQLGPFWAGVALFGMHLLGLIVAIPVAYFLNRKMIKGSRLHFALELPPYQWPKFRDVMLAMYGRGKTFVQTAGTIIAAMSVVIWALSYYPRAPIIEGSDAAQQEHQLQQSFLGRAGKVIEPVFVPAGFDWRISTAILSAFPARETVVPSLGIIFSLGGDADAESVDLRKKLRESTWPDGRPLFTPWVAAGLMVFFALCAQCMATLAAVKRETNSWRWAAFMFGYMTLLAYVAAVAIHQVARALGQG
jgi:ferrous iron transport protein B